MVTISIILPTRDRPDALHRVLDSIGKQDYAGDFETVVNNQSGAVTPPNAPGRGRFTHVQDTQKGLSRGKNNGAREAQGQYLFFIDDDAVLEPDCLTQIAALIDRYQCQCLCGLILNVENHQPFSRYQKKDQHGIAINRYNFNHCLGSAMVIEKSLLQKIGWFDERFGSGKYFGASEESDLVLRLLDASYPVIYDSHFFILHPRTDPYAMDLKPWLKKHYHYGLGRGALLRKRFVQAPLWSSAWLLYSLLLPIGASLVSLLLLRTRQAGRYAISCVGRIIGFIRFP